jgi:hypothetical protein
LIPLEDLFGETLLPPSKDSTKLLRLLTLSRDELVACVQSVFRAMQQRAGIVFESTGHDRNTFEVNLEKAIRCDDLVKIDIKSGGNLQLRTYCKLTLTHVSGGLERVREYWISKVHELIALITGSCPEWKTHQDDLCKAPPSAAVRDLIMNPVYLKLSDMSEAANNLYDCLKPLQGFAFVAPTLLTDLHDISYHATVTVSITFVLFHLFRVFPSQKGPLMLKTAGATLRGQLQTKGAWVILPPCMQTCIERIVETGELPKPPSASAGEAR